MREVALFDAKNRLSALIQEVLDTGEAIVVTRHGAPVAQIAPFSGADLAVNWADLQRFLTARRDAFAAANPDAAHPQSWDDLKDWLDDR